MGSERDDGSLLRSVTFKTPPAAPGTGTGHFFEHFIEKMIGTKTAANMRISESLDYEPVQNKVFYDRIKEGKGKEKKRKFYGYTGHTLAKFLVTFCTGVMTGVFAVLMSKAVHASFEWKNEFAQTQIEDNGVFMAFFFNTMYSIALVTLAVALVQYWAPAAAGAGVTLVMAYLNGNHIPNLLRWETLVTKFVGTVCAVSGGLPMGPEGPMVHIGACVASFITYIECKCLRDGKSNCFGRARREINLSEKLKVLDEIVSDTDHREFLSAGVSAGISAAFGAPVGGVLFSMEEACSFWSRKTAWRCFIAAVLATFTMQVLNQSSEHGMLSFTGLRSYSNRDWGMQFPFIVINAAVAGLLGAVFNSLRMWLWKVRAAKTRHCLRIAEVVGLAFLCNICGYFIGGYLGQCKATPPEWQEAGHTYGFRFKCEEGEHNDLATLFLSSTHDTITHLFSVGHNPDQPADEIAAFSMGSLALYVIVYLVLMSIGAGLAIPGGLFMPSIVLGAAWGVLMGLIVKSWLPSWNIQPGVYALMAATGVLGGVFRSAISLVVLVLEGTRGIEFLFGVILAVIVANWVAHHIHHDGVYESELERVGNVYMLRDEPPHRLHTLTAEMIMATGVYGFKAVESVARVLEVLRTTTHNGFPVFNIESDPEGGDDGNRLEGLILRSQLLVLLQHRHFCDAQGRLIGREPDVKYEVEMETDMRTFFRRYFTHSRYISATGAPLDAMNLDNISVSGLDVNHLYLDLRPYMNRSPFTIRKDCSASRTHQAFVALGLRHLIVVDAHNRVVGMITRKDLDHAAGHGWWRVSHMAPNPKTSQSIGAAIAGSVSKIPSLGFLKNLMGNHSNGNLSHHSLSENGESSSPAANPARYGEERMALRLNEDGDEGHSILR